MTDINSALQIGFEAFQRYGVCSALGEFFARHAHRFWRKILKRLILMDRVIFVHETA
jgi:hypothetical protein